MERICILSVLVNNHFGVLTRVTGLFSRRGYNIVSLSVGETHHPDISRITIQTVADGAAVWQIARQLEKLEDVHTVALLPVSDTVVRELILAKLVVPPVRRETLLNALFGLPCHRPYHDEAHVVLEMTGNPEECTRFLEIIAQYTIVELCRTGVTALSTTQQVECPHS